MPTCVIIKYHRPIRAIRQNLPRAEAGLVEVGQVTAGDGQKLSLGHGRRGCQRGKARQGQR